MNTQELALASLLAPCELHPVMPLPEEDEIRLLDFTEANVELKTIDLQSEEAFSSYVFDHLIYGSGAKAGVGGYFENRVLYQRSQHFGGEEARSLHLGIDIWMMALTPVFAPMDGKIHSFADNAGFGNYGPTIILEHELQGFTFYTLYGHLSRASLLNKKKGMPVKQGETIAYLGEYEENGHWPAHLHFQVMTDMLGNEGDFPGVAAPSDHAYYATICPDPNLILNIKLLK